MRAKQVDRRRQPREIRINLELCHLVTYLIRYGAFGLFGTHLRKIFIQLATDHQILII